MTGPNEPDEGTGGFSFQDKRRIDPETGEVREQAAAPGPAPADEFDRIVEGIEGEFPDVDALGTGGAASTAGAAGMPGAAQAGDAADGDAAETVDVKVAELTADLQRVHAEYANYRKRVERDRETTKDLAVGAALGDLLPVLDDVGRARDHGDLEGAFKSVAESFESTVARLGLEKYGEAGDPFDPTIHEAISHATSPDVTGPTCTTVFQPGYRYKGRVLRPAIVAVTDPE